MSKFTSNLHTNEFKAHKWITYSNNSKSLEIHPISTVFQPVHTNPCNLISIFGKARQGKSFLMNCLAGEKEIFRISNEKDSCTQGIDISDKWLSLVDFSLLDHGTTTKTTAVTNTTKKMMHVGFVDAEGQGDKDVTYDANLICPILLTSKCVIFNWKGDLQKDHILSTLGIMTRAAKNVSNNTTATNTTSAHTTAKFGHLHVIFRDWQAVNTSENEVYNDIMNREGTSESVARDLIRNELLQSFESIRVWLFDPPTEYTKDLRQVLTFKKTSQIFRSQVRKLRETLSMQLKEPLIVAGNILTGGKYLALTQQIVNSLNSGEVVLPSSAYLNMMRVEANVFRINYENELKESTEKLNEHIKNSVTNIVPTLFNRNDNNNNSTNIIVTLYKKKVDALVDYNDLYSKITEKFTHQLYIAMGGTDKSTTNTTRNEGINIVETIVGEFKTDAKQINNNLLQKFLAVYQDNFNQWLLQSRQTIEKNLASDIKSIESKLLPLPEESELPDVMTLSSVLKEAYQQNLVYIGGIAYYGSDCKEVADAENVFTRYYDMLYIQLKEKNTKMISIVQNMSSKYYKDALQAIDKCVDDTVVDLNQQYPTGYQLAQLETILNNEYLNIKSNLLEQIKILPNYNKFLTDYDNYCKPLREKMVTNYNESKSNALSESFRIANGNIENVLQQLDLNNILEGVDSVEEKINVLGVSLQQISNDMQTNIVNSVKDWISNNQEEFDKYHSDLANIFNIKFQGYYNEAIATIEEEAEEEDDPKLSGDDEEDDEVELRKDSNTNIPQKKQQNLSAEEQRQKAKNWAQQQLGLNLNSKSSSTNKRGKASKIVVPMKSIEQQRKDALDYAKKVLKIDGTSPPSKSPSLNATHHNNANDNDSIASTLTNNTHTTLKVDVLKAAKEEARRALNERTNAAAEAAVARLTNKKPKK